MQSNDDHHDHDNDGGDDHHDNDVDHDHDHHCYPHRRCGWPMMTERLRANSKTGEVLIIFSSSSSSSSL